MIQYIFLIIILFAPIIYGLFYTFVEKNKNIIKIIIIFYLLFIFIYFLFFIYYYLIYSKELISFSIIFFIISFIILIILLHKNFSFNDASLLFSFNTVIFSIIGYIRPSGDYFIIFYFIYLAIFYYVLFFINIVVQFNNSIKRKKQSDADIAERDTKEEKR